MSRLLVACNVLCRIMRQRERFDDEETKIYRHSFGVDSCCAKTGMSFVVVTQECEVGTILTSALRGRRDSLPVEALVAQQVCECSSANQHLARPKAVRFQFAGQ